MAPDVYTKLARHLDNLPGGFPATESGVEKRILKRLFSEEEAALALCAGVIPEEAAVVAKRAGLGREEAARRLEEMAAKGLLFSIVRPGRPILYMAAQYVIGIWEYHLNDLDEGLVRDMNEYIPHLFTPEVWSKGPQLRTIPVERSLAPEQAVMVHEQARELVKDQKKFLVAPCICRREHQMVGEGCDKPLESCLVFGWGADYYLRNGLGARDRPGRDPGYPGPGRGDRAGPPAQQRQADRQHLHLLRLLLPGPQELQAPPGPGPHRGRGLPGRVRSRGLHLLWGLPGALPDGGPGDGRGGDRLQAGALYRLRAVRDHLSLGGPGSVAQARGGAGRGAPQHVRSRAKAGPGPGQAEPAQGDLSGSQVKGGPAPGRELGHERLDREERLPFPGPGQEGWPPDGAVMRRAPILIADTLAMILFSLVLGMFVEVVISGLTVVQSLTARAASIPVNLLTGRPYGWFRDRLFGLTGLDKARFFQAALGDTAAFALFQMPCYVVVLLLAGATWSQIGSSVVSFTILVAFSGRIYGVFLDFCRGLALRMTLGRKP